ncbi:MAG: rRNA maturation RNase YbeY [Chloroherpetonaceae bacterium]|nr:rRNA maturation RNase YbeY [Chloroherpetonaceae bacterium]
MITISNTTKQKIPKRLISLAIEETIEGEKHSISDISAVYCGDKFIKKINEKYLSHHYATDTISFRLNKGTLVEGEFYISLDTVRQNAIRFYSSYKQELIRVTIHSCLHLVGYKDNTKDEKALMFKKENKYISKVITLL